MLRIQTNRQVKKPEDEVQKGLTPNPKYQVKVLASPHMNTLTSPLLRIFTEAPFHKHG